MRMEETIPVVDLDSQELESVPQEQNLKRKDSPVLIQLIDNDCKRKKISPGKDKVSSHELRELNKRISSLEEMVRNGGELMASEGPYVSREEFDRTLDRIQKIEERVQKIENILRGIKNAIGEKSIEKGKKQLLQQSKSHVQRPTVIRDKRVSNIPTPKKVVNSKTQASGSKFVESQVLNRPSLESHNQMGSFGQKPSNSSEVAIQAPILDAASSSAFNENLTLNEEEEDDFDELDPTTTTIPIKQELYEISHSVAENSENDGNFRVGANGRIIAIICGTARKLRNKNTFAAVYCWSVSDTMQHYYSELKTQYIKIQAEILAGIFALRYLRDNHHDSYLQVTVAAKWPKLVEVMTKKTVYPFKDNCSCLHFPCNDNPKRWFTLDALAKYYPDDLPRLILAQEGLDVQWVTHNECEIPQIKCFNNVAKNYLNESLRK